MKTIILTQATAIARNFELKRFEYLINRLRTFVLMGAGSVAKILTSDEKMRYGENLWKF